MRSRHHWRIAYTLLALYISAPASRATAATPKAGTTTQGGRMARQLDPMVQKLFALDLAPGMAIAAVSNGEIVYARGLGYADIETRRPVDVTTRFYVASTTKSFTAFAAALLHKQGRLDLDAPIARYLAGVRLHEPLSPNNISLRDLLTHTHGIANSGPITFRTAFTGEHTKADLLDLLRMHPPSETGREFSYGNIGYNVAGLVVEAATGTGWKELVEREVLAPAGMSATTAYLSRVDPKLLALPHWPTETGFRRIYNPKADANMHAAGGHATTVLDLARWIELHLQAGRLDGNMVFPSEVVTETHRLQAKQANTFGPYARYGWGLGWDLGIYDGDTLIHRFGSFFGGYRSHVSFMPARGVGVAVLVNEGALGSVLADHVANYVYDRLLGKPELEERWDQILAQTRDKASAMRKRIAEERAKRAARPKKLPHPNSAYVGRYTNAALGTMEWNVVDGALIATMGLLRSEAEVFDAEQNKLRVELTGGGEVVQFEFEGEIAFALTYQKVRFDRVNPR
ncbi:MAG: beta-lactamase family protein [Candidatus Latescibacteria bacterium]|nr:beta-lactamase family protein [Candidatus Latescibacterota bacterium]